MTPGQAASEIEKFSRRLDRELQKAEQDSLTEAAQIAADLSSGPFKQFQLTAMGHPYAVSNPNPPQDAAIINTQTGTFKKAWQTQAGEWDGDSLSNKLVNADRVADWLDQGTKKMIARPIQARICERLEPVRLRNLEEAIRKAGQ